MRRSGVILITLALLGGTSAAFAITQALKLERSPITAPKFDRVFAPTCGCPTARTRLRMRLREAARLTVTVVNRDGRPVRGLVENLRFSKGAVNLSWDGRTDGGALAPDGRYRVRIHFPAKGRTILVPQDVRLDTKPPVARIVRVPALVFSPDGDGKNDHLKVVYTSSEKGAALVLADAEVAVRGKPRAAGLSRVTWAGRIGDEVKLPGTYLLELRVRDRAGNLSKPIEGVPVRLRFIELARITSRVRAGGVLRFRVVADALPFRWQLLGPDAEDSTRLAVSGEGERNVVVVRLPRRVERGRYLLRVEARGNEDEAVVFVTGARP